MSHSFRLGFLTHLEGDAEPHTLYRRFIDLFVRAEELGFDAGWVAQHHFQDGRNGPGAGASPLTFLMAAAENTKRIRLGTAVVTLPLEQPIRLAEDASTLDAISGGRLELGVGSGYEAPSFKAFGVDIENKRELTSKALDQLYRAIDGEPLVPGTRTILQPRAPDLRNRIWQGIFGHEGARYAAEAGSNLLLNRAAYGYEGRTDHVQRPWADTFLAAWKEHPRNLGRQPRIGLSRLVYPAADRRTAKAHLEVGVRRMADYMVAQGRFPAGLDLEGYLDRLHAFYGHPDEVIEKLRDEQTLPIATDILCQVNPGVPTFDQTLKVLELIATEVAPTLGWKPKPASTGQDGTFRRVAAA